jgi:hypothetical protein
MKKLFIIFAVLCLAAPVMAADWNFYGSARFATFWVDDDPGQATEFETTSLMWDQQGNSRIGATVKFNDEIGGAFEMADDFGKRKLYGTYTFGAGELLIGQTYTPLDKFYSDSVFDGDGDLLGVGSFYESRIPMIQFKTGGLEIALIRPSTEGVENDETPTDDQSQEIATLPKVEVNYQFKTDMFAINVGGGYNTYDYEARGAGLTTVDDSVDSYVVAAGALFNIGPAYINVAGHMGQNLGNYGVYNPMNGTWERAANDEGEYQGGQFRDNDAYGFLGVVGFKASEMFNIEAGYGFQSYELDVENSEADETTQYYVNCTITITPGFFLVPEVGLIDFADDNSTPAVDQGDATYAGMKWQINF